MNVLHTKLPGVLILEPRVFGDARGFFFESWSQERYAAAGLPPQFVQDNVSLSPRGVLRGLHLQWPHPQGKLVSVLRGEVYDVAVDVRAGSATFGEWVAVRLSDENKRQLWIPPGFAHGFQVLSEDALFSYKCTDYYHPELEATIAWNDPELAIDWPLAAPTLSAKDQAGVPLRQLSADRQPRLEATV
jgi:dTDP-4-dehydrorhamnose 3,5-epimerase